MAKRPTIGRNPLDTLVPESHLDAVVPDLLTSPPKAKVSPKLEGEEDLQARLAAQEAENLALREEVDKLQEQVAELKNRLAQAEPRWVTLQRLKES
jgi:predicted RNase H-like nuclease (RuvC/YqgF family)